MTIINVNTNKAYNVILGDNITETAINDYLIGTTINKVLIVSDDIVAPLYLEKITEIFENNGLLVYNKIIANGELSKNTTNYLDIIDTLSNYNFHRLDCIVALGGGVVGDLASFCASTYLRGIHLIQIPTTLLSVIDSSVGGKTAINLAKGKNLLGSFYQPNLVIADLTLLETLPDIQWQNGKGELIKYTLLNDTNLLELCEDGISKNLKS
ncbi:MAG: 3-dehydroquinate synthase family protein, partial [Clostridia bacterium]